MKNLLHDFFFMLVFLQGNLSLMTWVWFKFNPFLDPLFFKKIHHSTLGYWILSFVICSTFIFMGLSLSNISGGELVKLT
jgi:hypothetical protein